MSSNESSSLFTAIDSGDMTVLELLLARRANVNDKMPSGDGDRALHRAARVAGSVEMVERLLQCGAKIDALNQAKMTALGIAASSERWEIVRTLLEHGANANVASNRTPLHWAATTGNLEMVTLLLEKHAKVDAVDKEGQTPLQRAMRARHVEVVRELMSHRASLSARDQFGRTALHTAAASGTYELLQELVHEHGVDVASRSNDGSGALHYSCCWTDEADSTRMRETTRTLLALGCPVDLVTRSLHTPLHHHLRKSTTHSLPLVEDLVKARASVNARAQDGATPLHYAAQCDGNVVAFLISSDAYIEARDVNDRTPIFYAAASCNEASCKVLLDYGADKYARDKNDRMLFHNSNAWAQSLAPSARQLQFDAMVREYEPTSRHWSVEQAHAAPYDVRRTVYIVTLIRSLETNSVWFTLPNELLFEIFQYLECVPAQLRERQREVAREFRRTPVTEPKQCLMM